LAFITITPNPQGSGQITGGTVPGYHNFTKYRTFKGLVQGRLFDVTFDSGYRFSYFYLNLELVNSSGAVRGRAQLTKQWGVPPAFKNLGMVSQSGELLRLRVTSASDNPSNIAGAWYTATYELRFDPAIS
jgi:hypothetical protein